jgi:23S rRNA (guanosine2251-2'-O)-methyltransferase
VEPVSGLPAGYYQKNERLSEMDDILNTDNSGSVFFEGMISFRSVVAAIRDGRSDRRIKALYFDSEKKQKLSKHLSYIKAMSHELSFPIYYTDKEEISSFCQGGSHGGILTVCTERTYPTLTNSNQIKKDGFYVVLDGIEDPYNFAFSLRAAYASGADAIILPERNWMSSAGTVCRSSAGASELIDTFILTSDSVKALKASGIKIVCAEMEDSIPMADADLTRPLALVIGGEKRGISSFLLENADARIRIDYGRDFSQALPAACASSITCFEVLRQNTKN